MNWERNMWNTHQMMWKQNTVAAESCCVAFLLVLALTGMCDNVLSQFTRWKNENHLAGGKRIHMPLISSHTHTRTHTHTNTHMHAHTHTHTCTHTHTHAHTQSYTHTHARTHTHTHTAHYENTAGHGSPLLSSSPSVCVCTSEAKANTRCVWYTHISTHTSPSSQFPRCAGTKRQVVCVCQGGRVVQIASYPLRENKKTSSITPTSHFLTLTVINPSYCHIYVSPIDSLLKNRLLVCRYCLKLIASVPCWLW